MEFRAHCHATEDEERVLQAFTFVSGIDTPRVARAEGYHGNPIVIFIGLMEDAKSIDAFWKRVREAGELDSVVETLEKRLDDDCVFHLRFDKQEAYAGRLKVARHDDVVTLKAKVAAYPARREKAVETLLRYFEGG